MTFGAAARVAGYHARLQRQSAVLDWDDYWSVGMLALWRKGISRGALASVVAKRQMVDERRAMHGRPASRQHNTAHISLEALTEAGFDWPSQSESAEASVIRNETAKELHKAIGYLSERQRRMLVAYYWHGWTLRQIAAEEGVSQSRISDILKAARRNLRQMLWRLG